jgi:hypothetical protein
MFLIIDFTNDFKSRNAIEVKIRLQYVLEKILNIIQV